MQSSGTGKAGKPDPKLTHQDGARASPESCSGDRRTSGHGRADAGSSLEDSDKRWPGGQEWWGAGPGRVWARTLDLGLGSAAQNSQLHQPELGWRDGGTRLRSTRFQDSFQAWPEIGGQRRSLRKSYKGGPRTERLDSSNGWWGSRLPAPVSMGLGAWGLGMGDLGCRELGWRRRQKCGLAPAPVLCPVLG